MDRAFFQSMDWAQICGIFEEKYYRLDFGKENQQPKAAKRLVKYENSEKKNE